MSVHGDDVARALADTWELLFAGIADGWFRREGGVVAAVSHAPVATLNGVWSERVDLDAALVDDLLDQVEAYHVPCCLQLRTKADPALTAMATARGMSLQETIPLMLLEDPSALTAAQDVDTLVVRELAPEEAGVHARIMALGFGAPEAIFAQLLTPSVLALSGVRCYVGEVGSEPVTTSLGATVGSSTGVFNVATPPEHRGHGYGAALTARAAADGLAEGAEWAWLQSSAAGYGIYQKLGFRTVESWPCWIKEDGARGQTP